MNELTEGIDALAERRKMERERLDERLGMNRERVEQEELYAPHMQEEQYINRDQLLKDYARLIDKQQKENESLIAERDFLKAITDKILHEFPVGNITEHTIESIPERISYYLKELAEYTQRVEDWEQCADNLVDYAHEFVANLSTWGKGYNRYDQDIKQAEDAIEVYNKLKK
jgi:hypothetical protein